MWRAKFYLNVHDVTTFVHFHVRGQMCHSLLSKLTGEHVPRAAADSLWVCHFAVCNTHKQKHITVKIKRDHYPTSLYFFFLPGYLQYNQLILLQLLLLSMSWHSCQHLMGVNLSPKFVNLYFPYAGRVFCFFAGTSSILNSNRHVWQWKEEAMLC